MNTMPDGRVNYDRVIGALESGLASLDGKLDDIKDQQTRMEAKNEAALKEQAKAIEQAEVRQSEYRRQIQERFDREEDRKDAYQARMLDLLSGVRDDINKFTNTADMVDSHAEAILDLEKRVATQEQQLKTTSLKELDDRLKKQEEDHRTRMIQLQQNKRWLKIITGVITFFGTLGIGGHKIAEWFARITK